ncbi:hypothetical protein NEOLEDRAFT_1071902 [Neolentinus lepideus HHB14362 ss-1]|uniref:Fungal-type protein kinase domain-containing protein n=1 Tax=Neolentinus lepideus HHB14362 ss-1 TaxID=1314782 RepID=A0A165QDS5_9AGAM|nr:hypothetical protein NEOLEDRAFT_1071902 [Neolentinus lepideus HHB14362 ss-1]
MQPTTAPGPWPEILMHSFFVAAVATSDKPHYGSWNRLLNTVFPVDTMFEVVSQVPPVALREAVDFVVLLLIYVEATPVFVVQIRPPTDFRLFSKRQEADEQLRRRLVDLALDLQIPVLHGISAFGTRIAFYKYDLGTRRMELRRIACDPELVADIAPREWWAFDIVEEGARKFRAVVEEMKEMCGKVSF